MSCFTSATSRFFLSISLFKNIENPEYITVNIKAPPSTLNIHLSDGLNLPLKFVLNMLDNTLFCFLSVLSSLLILSFANISSILSLNVCFLKFISFKPYSKPCKANDIAELTSI